MPTTRGTSPQPRGRNGQVAPKAVADEAPERGELMVELETVTRILADRLQRVMAKYFDEMGVTVSVAHAVRSLSAPMTMSELAELLDCDASYITMLADRMEERGFAKREPDPGDRRIRRLVRTPVGDQLAANIDEQVMAHHPVFANLTTSELASILILLRKGLEVDDSS